jgi:hypothetical protein
VCEQDRWLYTISGSVHGHSVWRSRLGSRSISDASDTPVPQKKRGHEFACTRCAVQTVSHHSVLALYYTILYSHCTHHTVLTILYSPYCTHHTVLTILYSPYCTRTVLTILSSHCIAPTLYLHCIAPTLYLHCIVPTLYLHCIVPTLHSHCIVPTLHLTVLYLHCTPTVLTILGLYQYAPRRRM